MHVPINVKSPNNTSKWQSCYANDKTFMARCRLRCAEEKIVFFLLRKDPFIIEDDDR
jgi:hypothetical protein